MPDGRRRFSLAGKLAVLVAADVVVTAALGAVLVRLLPWPAAFALSLAGGLAFSLWALSRALASVTRTLQALTDGVRGFRDQDFSLRLSVRRRDELGELVGLYNEMGDALRAERHDLFQRELLLDTVLQGAPVAIALSGPTGRVVYANRAARDLLGGGRKLEGRAFEQVLDGCPAEMREALAASGDALFTVGRDGEEETYRTVRRNFHLNTQLHSLYMAERLTPELRRREVEVWKKAIRVMNHELNNSLAPIRSLVHSARQVLGRPEHAHRLEGIFETLEDRAAQAARRVGRVPGGCPPAVPVPPRGTRARRAGLLRPRAAPAGPHQPAQERVRGGERGGRSHGVRAPDGGRRDRGARGRPRPRHGRRGDEPRAAAVLFVQGFRRGAGPSAVQGDPGGARRRAAPAEPSGGRARRHVLAAAGVGGGWSAARACHG